MDKINWGIIGCGKVCEVKSGPAFSKVEHSNLVAVMRRNADKASDYAKKHHVPIWYSDADELIHNAKVNAIYIATPPSSHLEYVRKAAKAGKPVYVEKPMGRTFAECEEMIRVCKDAGVPLFVAYYRRRLPYFLKVKKLLDSRAIGTPTLITLTLIKSAKQSDTDPETNWRINPEISGGGYFHDLASHQFDLFHFLLGDIREANGSFSTHHINNEGQDSISASFQFESGLVGSGSWTFTSIWEHYKDEVVIYGDQGKLTFACFNGKIPIVLETSNKRTEFNLPYPEHVQQPLITTIVDELMGKGKSPSTGQSASKANWVIDQVLKSAH
ncbi:MAG: gfo/Idh/MocA family oxidoreductase [Balneola sp.]|nr:MAG: gfo/Idh/MocA family oxidoreductase [Balneola sp.]